MRNTSVPPPELASGVERVVTELRFGGNAVNVENRAHPGLTASGPLGGSAAPTTGPGSAGSSGAQPAAAARADAAAPAGTPAAAGQPASTPASLVRAAIDISLAAFYPVLFLAACVVVGIDSLFRHLAVRTP